MIKEFDVKIPGWNGHVGRPAIVMDDITEFMKSGAQNCEVCIKSKATYTRNKYQASIKRIHAEDTVGVVVRRGRVFLVRKEIV